MVIKGEDKSPTWNYTLTADEQSNSPTIYVIKWKKFTSSSSDYVRIGTKTFLSTLTLIQPLVLFIAIKIALLPHSVSDCLFFVYVTYNKIFVPLILRIIKLDGTTS